MKEYIVQVNAPETIACFDAHNALEIIRCKDCRFYRKPEYGFAIGDCTYAQAWYPTKEDGFCSDAKRKE